MSFLFDIHTRKIYEPIKIQVDFGNEQKISHENVRDNSKLFYHT